MPALYRGQTHIDDQSRKSLYDAVGVLNTLLEGKTYVIGSDQPTLADLSLLASVANIVVSEFLSGIRCHINLSLHFI